MKLLAAAEPLSLQAHPSEDQAADGHRRERAAGVSRDAAHRNYRDRSDKPGLICALTECHALCGFRVESETLDLLTTLDVRGLDPLVSIFAELGPSAIRRAFDLIMHLPGAALAELVPHVLEACAELSGSGHRFALEYQTVRHAGPQLLFAVDGEMLVRDRHGRERRVPQGGSTWIPAGHCPVSIHGTGSLFRATDGVSGEPSALPGGNNQGGSDR
jgi:mannose-6-phosphate isomerase